MPACGSTSASGLSPSKRLEGARVVARHARAVGKGIEILELDHYLEVLSIKPGALAGASALAPGPSARGASPRPISTSGTWPDDEAR